MRLALACVLGLTACGSVPLISPGPPEGVRFEGNQSLSDSELSRALMLELADWRASSGARAYADDASYQLAEVYRARGFAEVQTRFETSPTNLTLFVEEGPRVELAGLTFPGYEPAEGLDVETLAAFYAGPGSGTLGKGRPYFVRNAVDDLRRVVRGELVARGYLDASVAEPVIELDPQRGEARVALPIEAGPRYRTATLELTLEQPLEGLELEERLVPFRQRSTYTSNLPSELQAKLLDALQEAGYADATVVVETRLERETASAFLTVIVEAGDLIRLGEVLLEGDLSTRSSFIRSRILVEPGQPVRASEVRDSVSRLYRTGLFRSVQARLKGDGSTRDLALEMNERPSRELFAEPGYGSYELFRMRIGARERNLFGTGRTARAEATIAVRALRALIAFSDPWFLREELIFDLSAEYDQRQEPSFTSESRGVGAYLTHEWDIQGRRATTFGYAFRRSKLKDVEVVTSEVLEALEDVQLSGLRLNHTEDSRDQPLLPSRGSLYEFASEWGDELFGSDLDYVRLSFAHGRYYPLGEERTLALGARAGVILPEGRADDIPLQERFFNGGENTVRSYMESELGPTDSENNPIGGEAFTLGSVELRQRLGGSGWQAAVFFDTGNVTPRAEDYWDLDGFGWGVGVGLRYILPVGPVRLDVAGNPDANRDESDFAVHLAVGLAF